MDLLTGIGWKKNKQIRRDDSMKLYINGSNRKGNCSKILNDLKEKEDELIELSDKSINYCLGCNSCMDDLEGHCILEDDMRQIYEQIFKADKIIIATPIYMNHITGLLKNVIDRFNPFSGHDDLFKGKTIYLITVGQMNEEENEEIATNIKEYFESIGEFMGFETVFLKNFTSGDIKTLDDIAKVYDNYSDIIEELKIKIKNK